MLSKLKTMQIWDEFRNFFTNEILQAKNWKMVKTCYEFKKDWNLKAS